MFKIRSREKAEISLLFLHQNQGCVYLLELPWQSDSSDNWYT